MGMFKNTHFLEYFSKKSEFQKMEFPILGNHKTHIVSKFRLQSYYTTLKSIEQEEEEEEEEKKKKKKIRIESYVFRHNSRSAYPIFIIF